MSTMMVDPRLAPTVEAPRMGRALLVSAADKLHVVRVDGFTLLPIHTQLAACIAGFYFGAGIAKAK
jgi:hypothetical protein